MLKPPEVKNRKFLAVSNSFYDDYLKPNYWNKTAKDYKQILFKAGKPLQSRELNFLQSIFHDKLKTMCDINYRNGSIINGCAVQFDGEYVRTSEGIVYWDGTFFDVSPMSAVNSNSGMIYVYFCPVYQIINSDYDKELEDPAIRYKIDEGVSGADRLKITFELRLSDDKTPLPVQRILIASIDTEGNVSLLNRNYDDTNEDEDKITEVTSGLKIRNNKTYYEIESGHGLIDGNEVVFDGYKALNIDELREKHEIDFSNEEEFLRENAEVKFLDVRDNPLRGAIWGDVACFGSSSVGMNEMAYNGLLNPGQKVYIMAKIDNEIPPTYVTFGTAEIAEVYNVLNPKLYFQKFEFTPIKPLIIHTPNIVNLGKISINSDPTKSVISADDNLISTSQNISS